MNYLVGGPVREVLDKSETAFLCIVSFSHQDQHGPSAESPSFNNLSGMCDWLSGMWDGLSGMWDWLSGMWDWLSHQSLRLRFCPEVTLPCVVDGTLKSKN